MKSVTILLFSLCFLAVTSAFANPDKSDNIRMFLDFARFRYDESNTYLEIYYLLYMNKHENANPGESWLEFQLTDTQKDSILAKDEFKISLNGDATERQSAANVKGSLIKTVLPTGKYMIKMVRLDASKQQRLDSLSQGFTTPSFEKDKIAMSDIELCSNIISGSQNKKGLFYKNTLEVFPNPMNMFGPKTPNLFYYIELYNVMAENPQDKVNIEIAIANTKGEVVAQKRYTKQRTYESLVEVGAFNVSNLDNGLYTIIFAASDPVSNYSVYTRNNFYVMDPDQVESKKDLMTLFSKSDYLNMAEQEVDDRFAQSRYVATKNEVQIYESLDDVESKRFFMFKFWYERENEGIGLSGEYFDRVAHANQLYAFANLQGWQTDRGRVFIKYGEPDQIDRKPSNRDNRPYIIWFYQDMDGGAKFLFVDNTGFGDYRLMSSTLRGEVYDPSWDQLLLFGQF